MEYWELLSPKLPPGRDLSQKESMRRLNKARVALKHNGTFPSKLDIESFRATAMAFFDENTPTIFGVALAEVSLVEFVRPAEAKASLEEAEVALKVPDVGLAVSKASLAFEQMLRDYEHRKRRFGRSPFYFGKNLTFLGSSRMGVRRMSNDRSERQLAEFVDNVKESLESLCDVTKILALGIDYRRYSRFRLATPRVHWGIDGRHALSTPPQATTLEDARYCIEFVIETAIRLHEFDYEITHDGSA